MPVPTDIQCQVDFSGGQINSSALRRDDIPVVQTGALALLNFRSEAQGTALSRPGRDALYTPSGGYRTEFVRMSAAATFHVSFPAGVILITDTLGNVVFTSTSGSYLWTNATVSQVSVAVLQYTVMICFPGMQPEVLTWNPSSSTWSAAPFAWSVIAGNFQEPFFRSACSARQCNGRTRPALSRRPVHLLRSLAAPPISRTR